MSYTNSLDGFSSSYTNSLDGLNPLDDSISRAVDANNALVAKLDGSNQPFTGDVIINRNCVVKGITSNQTIYSSLISINNGYVNVLSIGSITSPDTSMILGKISTLSVNQSYVNISSIISVSATTLKSSTASINSNYSSSIITPSLSVGNGYTNTLSIGNEFVSVSSMISLSATTLKASIVSINSNYSSSIITPSLSVGNEYTNTLSVNNATITTNLIASSVSINSLYGSSVITPLVSISTITSTTLNTGLINANNLSVSSLIQAVDLKVFTDYYDKFGPGVESNVRIQCTPDSNSNIFMTDTNAVVKTSFKGFQLRYVGNNSSDISKLNISSGSATSYPTNFSTNDILDIIQSSGNIILKKPITCNGTISVGGSSTLNTVTVSGNTIMNVASIGGNTTTNRIQCNNVAQITTASANVGFLGSNSILLSGQMTGGAYNNIVGAGDCVIVANNSSQGLGSLSLTIWNNGTNGIRINSTATNIVGTNVVVIGNTTINGTTSISNNLTINGTTSISNNLTVNGTVSINGIIKKSIDFVQIANLSASTTTSGTGALYIKFDTILRALGGICTFTPFTPPLLPLYQIAYNGPTRYYHVTGNL
jgi:uncharacterized protein (DUF736 family)